MAGISINTLLWALVGGIIPTFLWLWFWFNQTKRPEHTGTISIMYILGMVCVFIVIPLNNIIEHSQLPQSQYLLAFAAVEEITKVLVTILIAFRRESIQHPEDYTMYLVTTALGFSGIENTLYLIQPIVQHNIGYVLMAGNLRFIGSTLLHTVCVAIVGIMVGIVHDEGWFIKLAHIIIGLGLAISLHGAFNYFIMVNTTRSIIIGLSGLWFVGMIVVVMFGRIQKLQQFRRETINVLSANPLPTNV